MESKYIDTFKLETPLSDYPRPQLKRENYQCYNGRWEFEVSSTDELPAHFYSVINVPYCVESRLSGIHSNAYNSCYLNYRKIINKKRLNPKDRCIFHIDACDRLCNLYVNRQLACTNDNGYLPIVSDITDFLKDGDNEIIIQAFDNNSLDYPYGKQSNNPHGMWYNRVSGIWKTVWSESVSLDYIKNIKITPDIDKKEIQLSIDSNASSFEILVLFKGHQIKKLNSNRKEITISFSQMSLWSPENPLLYDLIIKTKRDEVKSYFAFRKFSFDEKHFLLNNKPYFIHGLLDQGYYVDGIYTPCSYEEVKNDILVLKNLGFNTLRKHIKIEPMMFYYLCDRFGMLVFQDFVNNGDYSYAVDTVLPTIRMKGLASKLKKEPTTVQKKIFEEQIKPVTSLLYNSPSVVYYTIFNEGWGQHDADRYYDLVKELDPTRVIDTTSGWFFKNKSDVTSDHVYFRKIKVKNKWNRPFFVSEFGGYNLKIKDHFYKTDKEYGYKGFKTKMELNQGILKLYKNEVIANIKNGLAGCIYTQVSDVEEELNGIFTYDRKEIKLNKSTADEIKKGILKEITEQW